MHAMYMYMHVPNAHMYIALCMYMYICTCTYTFVLGGVLQVLGNIRSSCHVYLRVYVITTYVPPRSKGI